ncbi:MAG: response regulator transcription factor [Bacteroidota bacterium]
MTSLFLVEDQPIFLEGLKSIFTDSNDFEIRGVAHNGKEAIEKIENMVDSPPEVILMDIRMPKMDGIETTRALKEVIPDCKILMLTGHKELWRVKESIKAHVDGYILKDDIGKDIKIAIETALEGEPYFSRSIVPVMKKIIEDDNPYSLSVREIEVIQKIMQGYTSKEIASALFRSENTILAHRRNIYKKLKVNNLVDLTRKVQDENILPLDKDESEELDDEDTADKSEGDASSDDI